MELTDDERAKYWAVFREFDTDGDEVLTYDELRTALVNAGYNLDEKDFQNFLSIADPEKKGCIDFYGFEKAVANRPSRQQKMAMMRRLFRVMDTDGSGLITLKDLKKLTRESGSEVNKDELKKIILSVDKDGDRKVSFEEFAEYMSKN